MGISPLVLTNKYPHWPEDILLCILEQFIIINDADIVTILRLRHVSSTVPACCSLALSILIENIEFFDKHVMRLACAENLIHSDFLQYAPIEFIARYLYEQVRYRRTKQLGSRELLRAIDAAQDYLHICPQDEASRTRIARNVCSIRAAGISGSIWTNVCQIEYANKTNGMESTADCLPLALAAGLNLPHLVAQLLQTGVRPEGDDHIIFGNAISVAAYHGHIEVLDMLLTAVTDKPDVDPDQHLTHFRCFSKPRNQYLDNTPIPLAAYAGQLDAVKLLTSEPYFPRYAVPLDLPCCDHAASQAIFKGKIEVFNYLLTRFFVTPTGLWIESERYRISNFMAQAAGIANVPILLILLDILSRHHTKNCSVFNCDPCQAGAYALNAATDRGRLNIIRLLVEHGISINTGYAGITCISYVNDLVTLKLLHSLGANLLERHYAKGLLWHAREGRFDLVAYFIEHDDHMALHEVYPVLWYAHDAAELQLVEQLLQLVNRLLQRGLSLDAVLAAADMGAPPGATRNAVPPEGWQADVTKLFG